MDKKMKLALACLMLLTLLTVATATVYYTLHYPQQVTVQPYGTEVYVDTFPYSNNTAIDWGTVYTNSTTSKELDVKNIGNTAYIRLHVQGLPSDWSLTWVANNTLLNHGEWANGTLTLSIPTGAYNGTYAWDSWISAEYP